jgi:hypothetical protein
MTHEIAPAVGEFDPTVKRSRRLRVLMTHWDGSGNTCRSVHWRAS